MKFVWYMACIAALSIPFATSGTPYNKAQQEFKEILYSRQIGLMDQEAYFKFIDPFLQKAEQNLRLAEHYKNNPSSASISEYFKLLADANVDSFHHYVQQSPRTTWRVEQDKVKFSAFIEKTKTKNKLRNVDTNQELEETFKLLEEANKAYYQQLGLKHKSLLYLGSLFNGRTKQ
jgi:hypothetical protein